jgi:uncharacterized protein YndB with AHSA1/START domain
MSKDSIRWPSEYDPSRCPVHIINTLEMSVSPADVWEQLTAAADWPIWYASLSNVQIEDGSRKLSQGVDFTWRTFGADIASTVKEFVPNERLAWDARGTGLRAYHAWLLIPTPNGCRVLTEETQRGFVARLFKVFMPNRMSHSNQKWLEALATQSSLTRS